MRVRPRHGLAEQSALPRMGVSDQCDCLPPALQRLQFPHIGLPPPTHAPEAVTVFSSRPGRFGGQRQTWPRSTLVASAGDWQQPADDAHAPSYQRATLRATAGSKRQAPSFPAKATDCPPKAMNCCQSGMSSMRSAINSTQSATSSTQRPMNSTRSAINSTRSPISSTRRPTSSTQSAMSSTWRPIDSTRSGIHWCLSGTHSTQTAINSTSSANNAR